MMNGRGDRIDVDKLTNVRVQVWGQWSCAHGGGNLGGHGALAWGRSGLDRHVQASDQFYVK